ncbi:hypothetical protein CTI14_01425 [Methylobacterium radiotolerans]|nr:hypothetical protein CTI14_01425 [Methylobacterium radiotolerans]
MRTPMQWSADRNGGFSDARPSRLVAPLPTDGYAPTHVNAAAQLEDHGSLLHFVRDLTARYRVSPELGGGCSASSTSRRTPCWCTSLGGRWWGARSAVHNFAERPATTRFRLGEEPAGTTLVDLLDARRVTLDDDGGVELELPAYGYRWLRVSRPGDGRVL